MNSGGGNSDCDVAHVCGPKRPATLISHDPTIIP